LVIKNELPMGRLVDLGFNWIYLEQYRTVQDDISAIKAVTVDDVNMLIEQYFEKENCLLIFSFQTINYFPASSYLII